MAVRLFFDKMNYQLIFYTTMAKLQQTNEMTMANGNFFSSEGRLQYKGKTYAECLPFEKEQFNKALSKARGTDFASQLARAILPLFLQYSPMKKKELTVDNRVKDAIFGRILEKLAPDDCNTSERWVLSATHNNYDVAIYGEYAGDKIEYEVEAYKEVRGEWIALELTEAQRDALESKSYAEYRACERREVEERYELAREEAENAGWYDEEMRVTSDWYSL